MANTLTWYPCACGAEHDTPTCPFGAGHADAAPRQQAVMQIYLGLVDYGEPGSVWAYVSELANRAEQAEATIAALQNKLLEARIVIDQVIMTDANGVICSIPGEGIDAKPHRTWCAKCQRLWRRMYALSTALASALPPATPQEKQHDR